MVQAGDKEALADIALEQKILFGVCQVKNFLDQVYLRRVLLQKQRQGGIGNQGLTVLAFKEIADILSDS